MLLAILIACGIVLIGLSTVSATDSNNTTVNNTTVTVNSVNNTAGQKVNLTANVTSNGTPVTVGSVKFFVNNVSAGNASVDDKGIATLVNWVIPSNWDGLYTITVDFDGTGTNYANSTGTGTLTVTARVIKGYWMFSSDAASLNLAKAAALKASGITDVFVCIRDVNGNYHYSDLQNAINQLHPYGIKVHAWIVCFKNNDKFVNPSGYYSYKVAYPYKKIKYRAEKKVWYKHWYKSYGKWRYTWRYYWKSYWAYKWLYKYETKTGYNTSYNTQLINQIKYITQHYNVDGIHLDYVRYSGVAQYGDAAYQQPGGVSAAVTAVTAFVQSVSNAINSTNNLNITNKPYIQLSAALMPEANIRSDNGLLQNDYYYAQDYTQLSKYLDFLVPMTYEQNYNTNDAWITQMTNNIVSLANGKPVYSGLMTYDGDNNPSCAVSDLSTDVKAAYNGSASGYVLFRYGIGSSNTPNWP